MVIHWVAQMLDVEGNETEIIYHIRHDPDTDISFPVAMIPIVVEYRTHTARIDFSDGCLMIISVIYETHVKGMTMTHPDVPEHLRGTYAGMAHPSIIKYFQDLGVTAVELLPIHRQRQSSRDQIWCWNSVPKIL